MLGAGEVAAGAAGGTAAGVLTSAALKRNAGVTATKLTATVQSFSIAVVDTVKVPEFGGTRGTCGIGASVQVLLIMAK